MCSSTQQKHVPLLYNYVHVHVGICLKLQMYVIRTMTRRVTLEPRGRRRDEHKHPAAYSDHLSITQQTNLYKPYIWLVYEPITAFTAHPNSANTVMFQSAFSHLQRAAPAPTMSQQRQMCEHSYYPCANSFIFFLKSVITCRAFNLKTRRLFIDIPLAHDVFSCRLF